MPDDATQTPVEVPATTTPAAESAEVPQSAAQTTTQTPDPGSIDPARDFAHPEYGQKVKNAWDGMTKAQKEAADHKQARQALESNLAGVRKMVEEDPSVAASMVKYLESKGQTVPPQLKKLAEKAAAQQEDDDSRPLTRADEKRLREEMKAEFGSRDTVTEFQRALGGGDVAKGSVIYHQDGTDVLNVMEEYGFPPTPKHMLLAHKIVLERRGPKQGPTATPTPPSAASDMGRATGSAPTGGNAIDGPPTLEQWLKPSGFSSEEAYLRAKRSEG